MAKEQQFAPLRAFTRRDLQWRPVAADSCELRCDEHVLMRMHWLRRFRVAEARASDGRWILELDSSCGSITVINAASSSRSAVAVQRAERSWRISTNDETLRLTPLALRRRAWAITEGVERMIVSARVTHVAGDVDVVRIASAAAWTQTLPQLVAVARMVPELRDVTRGAMIDCA